MGGDGTAGPDRHTFTDEMSDRDPQPIGTLIDRKGLPNVTTTEPAPCDIAAIIRRQRLDAFHRQCPPEFHVAIDEAKLPNLQAWKESDAWHGDFPGLWLWSKATGMGKTRMLWRKFGELHVQRGMSVQRTTGLNLAEEYHDAFNRNQTANFYRAICCVQVVMMDDLDKMPLPERNLGFGATEHAARNARMLRELFDTFYEEHTRVVVTANQPIAWFAQRIGESAERRMRAVCVEVNF